MTLKHRISKIEKEISPPKRTKITVRLRREGDPEREAREGVRIIRVRLDTDD